jgi:hypothetical protein
LTKNATKNAPRLHFVHVYVHGMLFLGRHFDKNATKNMPKLQFVHIYVHGMNIWRPKFDAKRTQKYPKSALCTRIRARNEHLGTPF